MIAELKDNMLSRHVSVCVCAETLIHIQLSV